MGLDMYLYERHYCPSSWAKNKRDTKKTNFTTKVYDWNGNSKKVKFKDVEYIICRKGYWRKANQIHKFFIDKCADGVDDCRDVYVEDRFLKDLRDICTELLKLKGKKFVQKAQELLPTTDGFFFGGTEYNKWYRRDLRQTIKIINGLNLDSYDYNVDYIYRASW